jgi:endonuclease/exonuclease/phosphatase family metal-dependent hydrolase
MASQARAQSSPPINPDEGRPQVHWNEARQIVGKLAFVSGKCIDVNTAGRVTFINFDTQRPARFAGVIFTENLNKFPKPPKALYTGKFVRIRGTVSTFRGAPQIVITSPDQIEILTTLPPSTLGAESTPTPRRQIKPGQIVVAAYNVLNLFDDHDDPYRDDEGTPPKPREQMQHVAQSIEALNADVIALEEVENRDYLQRFVDVFLPDLGYDNVVLFEGNDLRGIDVALISRLPIGEVHDGAPARFNRDVLAVTIEPDGGQPFEMWCVHLKSNSGGREEAEPIRLAEARELRRLLDKAFAANPQARIIVTGDFNDTPGTPTLNTIIGQGSTALWSPASDLPGQPPMTYNTGDFKSMIDFMLCSPAMKARYVNGSFSVPQGSI